MKPAPTAAVHPRSRAWHSLVLAALVLTAGVIHQRATASGVFASGGTWDKLAASVNSVRQRLAEHRSVARARRDEQQRVFMSSEQEGCQPPWFRSDWRYGQPGETWEITFDDGRHGPYDWGAETHCQPRWINRPHCARWGSGW
jgi:hypothetical protein